VRLVCGSSGGVAVGGEGVLARMFEDVLEPEVFDGLALVAASAEEAEVFGCVCGVFLVGVGDPVVDLKAIGAFADLASSLVT
jgi:hypothetical protein